MEEGPRFFTVEEANGLVGALEIEFGRVARVRAELAPLMESFGASLALELLQERVEPPAGREEDARRLVALAAEITAAVERMNAMGCLVKDLEAGLVDFYAVQDDEPVFLCWQFGEPAVTHWHGLEEGFAGRQPIEGIEVRPPAYMN
ncbi:MAG TPA: DUF2203 domain-containing protein [Anaeromyxobacter sp.]|nr:DUF2203 domain-containing protein [Anaeromyxobacter sp.]